MLKNPLAAIGAQGPINERPIPAHDEIMRKIFDPAERAKIEPVKLFSSPNNENTNNEDNCLIDVSCGYERPNAFVRSCHLVSSFHGNYKKFGTATLVEAAPVPGVFKGARIALTAGRCIYAPENGGWADYVTVFPSYRQGLPNPTPFGAQTAPKNNLRSNNGWIERQDPDYDLGVIILPERFPVAGNLMSVEGKPLTQWLEMYHYPASQDFILGTMIKSVTQGAEFVQVTDRRIFFSSFYGWHGSTGGGCMTDSSDYPGYYDVVRAVFAGGVGDSTQCRGSWAIRLYQEFIDLIAQWDQEATFADMENGVVDQPAGVLAPGVHNGSSSL